MRRHVLIASLATALYAPVALGATSTLTFGIAVNVVAACTISGATLNFGTVGSLATAINGLATFTVTCNKGFGYTVALDKGINGTSVTNRKMRGGVSNSEYINYNLYIDPARTVNFTSGGGTTTGAPMTYGIWGRVPVQTTPSQGTYTDTVLITLTY
jgi:spore coat protein U-like protein